MPIVSRETVENEANKADEVISQAAGEEESKEAEGTNDAPTETSAGAEQPTQDADVGALKAEIDRLKGLLDSKNSATWESRYYTLQGMNKKMAEEMRELKAQVEELQTKTVSSAEPNQPTTEVLSKIAQDYGDGLYEEIKQLITSVVDAKLKDRLKVTDERINSVQKTADKTLEETFFSRLAILVPDWKQINGWEPEGIPIDPKWEAFLKKQAPGTNITYNTILHNSYTNHDADGVARIFNYFKDEQRRLAEAKKNQAASFVEPSATGGVSSASDVSRQKKTYTKAEIDNFYNSVMKGTFLGTDEEKKRLDDEYQSAMIEGRVR